MTAEETYEAAILLICKSTETQWAIQLLLQSKVNQCKTERDINRLHPTATEKVLLQMCRTHAVNLNSLYIKLLKVNPHCSNPVVLG